MSTNPNLSPETKREIDLALCVQELRSGKWRQIRGEFADGTDGRCAMGVMMEALSEDPFSLLNNSPDSLLGKLIPRNVWRAIVMDNNYKHLTLPEIGDKLERGEYPECQF